VVRVGMMSLPRLALVPSLLVAATIASACARPTHVRSTSRSRDLVVIQITDSMGYVIDRLSESCHLYESTNQAGALSPVPCDRLAANLPAAATHITWTTPTPPPAPPAPPPSELTDAAAPGDLSVVLTRAELDELIDALTSGSSGARIVPAVKDGAPHGFKLYAIRPSSPLARLGLANGDTVLAVNDHRLERPDQVAAAYQALRDASRFEIALVRRGAPLTLRIDIR
jgi:hypothetical protein